MSRVLYDTTSPYYLTPQNSRALDIWTPREISSYDTDKQLVIDNLYQFKPDLLAYDMYGSSRLWWVFAIRNKDLLIDPIYDFVGGLKIWVTDADTLKSVLNV